MPSLPTNTGAEGNNNDFEIIDRIKMVADYCNCSIQDALEFAVDYFQLCFKKAYISALSKTKEGEQYLKDCENINKTEIDVEGLEQFAGMEEEL